MMHAALLAAIAIFGAGAPPPCGQPTIHVADLRPIAAGGAAYPTSCRIVLDTRTALLPRWRARERCALILHEAGHLYGLGHAPRGVMRGDRLEVPPVCKRLNPWRPVSLLARIPRRP
jgi:hypothetical protein